MRTHIQGDAARSASSSFPTLRAIFFMTGPACKGVELAVG